MDRIKHNFEFRPTVCNWISCLVNKSLPLLLKTYSTSTIHAMPCFQKPKFLSWGIFIGLKLAAHLHIRKLEVESDSAVAVNLINSSDYDLHPLATIIGNCGAVMQLFDYCHLCPYFQHCHQNSLASLSNAGLRESLSKCSLSRLVQWLNHLSWRPVLNPDNSWVQRYQDSFTEFTGTVCFQLRVVECLVSMVLHLVLLSRYRSHNSMWFMFPAIIN